VIRGHADKTSAHLLYARYSEEKWKCKEVNTRIEYEFATTVLFNELQAQDFPIKTMEDLLLYLPLFSKQIFNDCLYRFSGDTYGDSQQNYIRQKLKFCYDRIDHKDAKQYADRIRKFMSEKPVVYDVTGKTRSADKLDKYDEWIRIAEQDMDAFNQFMNDTYCDNKLLAQWLEYQVALIEYASTTECFGDEFLEKAKEYLEAN
jgi:hypothetical protein